MRRAILLILLLTIPPIAVAVTVQRTQYPRRFAEVEPGALYRGGYPTGHHVRDMADEYRIRTIVNLSPGGDEASQSKELEECTTAAQLGIRVLPFPMPGDGMADFASLDAAADALADPANRPVFFHCAAGKMRSGAVLAAYRMKHCRWPLKEAMAEARRYGLDGSDEKETQLADHLASYEDHVRVQAGNTTTTAPATDRSGVIR